MKKERKYRVSCFVAGQNSADRCKLHRAPRTEGRAREVFLAEARKIGTKWAFVILHQGNLMRRSYRIIERLDKAPAPEPAAPVEIEEAPAVKREGPPLPPMTLDDATATYTAFATFAALLEAPGYRPSMNVSNPHLATLADGYDLAQQGRNDSRRTFRY